jgi:hypothetical protein
MTDLSQYFGVSSHLQENTGGHHYNPFESGSPGDNYLYGPRSTFIGLKYSFLSPTEVSKCTSALPRTSAVRAYCSVDQTFPGSTNFHMARSPQCWDNSELNWPSNISGAGADDSLFPPQHLLQQSVLPSQPCEDVTPSPSPTSGYDINFSMSNIPPPAPQAGLPYHYEPESACATIRLPDVSTPSSSSGNSDTDSSDSEYKGSTSTSGQRRVSRANLGPNHSKPHVINIMDLYSPPPARPHVCPRVDLGCVKRFARPENVRRHIITVHGDKRDHRCKVPKCATKPFSRGDNLRDHYWSHLERGGRNGTNDKMSLAKLKEILGPKESKLIKKLELRLIETLSKQRSPRQRP